MPFCIHGVIERRRKITVEKASSCSTIQIAPGKLWVGECFKYVRKSEFLYSMLIVVTVFRSLKIKNIVIKGCDARAAMLCDVVRRKGVNEYFWLNTSG